MSKSSTSFTSGKSHRSRDLFRKNIRLFKKDLTYTIRTFRTSWSSCRSRRSRGSKLSTFGAIIAKTVVTIVNIIQLQICSSSNRMRSIGIRWNTQVTTTKSTVSGAISASICSSSLKIGNVESYSILWDYYAGSKLLVLLSLSKKKGPHALFGGQMIPIV